MKLYHRVTKTLSDKGTFVESHNLQETLEKMIMEDPSADYYHSLFAYPEEILTYIESHNNSIKGYNGPAFSNYLFFDFDSIEDPNLAKEDTRKLINRLYDTYKVDVNSCVQVFYSGNKGFHLYVHLSEYLDRDSIENICQNIYPELSTLDRVIYNVTRIIRANNSKHQKTNNWKVEILPADLKKLTIEQINSSDRTKINRSIKPLNNLEIFDELKKPTNKVITADPDAEDRNSRIRGLRSINFDKCPKNTPRCIYALQHGIMVPGERSHVFLALARYYRNEGHPKELAYHTLKGIAELNAKKYPENEPVTKEEIWNTVIQSAYSSHSLQHQNPNSPGTKAEDKLLHSYCTAIDEYSNKPCSLHKRVLSKEVYNTDDMFNDFKNYASRIDKNTIKTGISFIDDNMTISRGEVTLLAGSNGSGKTTAALNLLENASHNDIPSVFYSLDMHRNQVFLKLAIRCTDYTKDQIKKYIREDPEGIGKEIKKAVKDRYKNVNFFFNATLTIEELRDRILELNKKNKTEIGLVLIDYAGRISGPYSDSYANAKYNALRSKEMADITNSAWIILSQIARKNGDGSTPLRSSRVSKDAGDWEECAANVITMWRPFMNRGDDEKDNVMRLFLAKNRMGPQLEGLVWWHGAKGEINNMTDFEIDEYRETRGEEEDEIYKSRYR